MIRRARISDVNRMDRVTFVDRFGGIYEHSPWVAEAAWSARPFDDREKLAAAMRDVVRNADREQQLGLLRNHPRLGILAGLTELSGAEQAGAGISSASDQKRRELAVLNDAYESKFGFPFIIAVRGLELAEIIESCRSRLERALDTEFDEALNQVFRIAEFRLGDAINSET